MLAPSRTRARVAGSDVARVERQELFQACSSPRRDSHAGARNAGAPRARAQARRRVSGMYQSRAAPDVLVIRGRAGRASRRGHGPA